MGLGRFAALAMTTIRHCEECKRRSNPARDPGWTGSLRGARDDGLMNLFAPKLAAVWTSDIGPHWRPQSFVDWPGYARLWTNLLGGVTGP